ncbi:MAG TPA: peptidoglycan DD-metalloendopeptidase family protein [Coriobacteriia bacterium]
MSHPIVRALAGSVTGRRPGVGTAPVRLALALLVCLSLGALSPAPAAAATLVQLRAQLETIRKDASPAGDAFEKATTELEDTQYRIKLTDARIKAQTKKLSTAETRLGDRADAMYRQGGEDSMVSFVLGSTTWDDFVTRLDYVTLIASSDAALVDEVKTTRAGLQKDRVRFVADAKVQAKQVAVLKTRKDVLEARLASKRAEYDRVLGQIAAQMATENPGQGSYPPGPNGMVFPVRGVHFYSNTWGAPRSGGRHHMGTDLMSPKGTPVVAVSSGSANPHFNGLGGKSITLKGDNGWTYYYAHLNGYAIKGGHVKAGQLIGYVGNTGNAAGGANHLHFQMGPGGRWVNPYSYLRSME